MPLYLIRHGETDWNKQGRIQGIQDIGLNERGIGQIQEASRRLRERMNVHAVISSPLRRARESAHILASVYGLSIKVDSRFAERSFGELEGKALEEIRTVFQIANPELIHSPIYGVEAVESMQRRVCEGIGSLEVPEERNVLLVTHGSIIRMITGQTEIVDNGTIVELTDNLESRLIDFFLNLKL
ncbi:histidine phosphatase family protein [Paenibacillus sabinae]|uniref:Phosphoglycerate mutase n=1 Tax=Paenibacillus sabinae T27 TaxID=1268072 RepID=X4ZH28_9BACL|nr:histidine phosphatase family protein [Paenibacillus sabinae]AHV96707.1 phosphoglycerate mutase [Paenibacillus sabinae T27]